MENVKEKLALTNSRIVREDPIVDKIMESSYIKSYCTESIRGRIDAYKDGFIVVGSRTGYSYPKKTWKSAYSLLMGLKP